VTPTAKAGALLAELGIVRPEDIDLEAMAFHCGATIVYEPLRGCEARLIGRGDRAIITVNSRSSLGRQRFSGAHEVGHWLYDRGEIALACTSAAMTSNWTRSGRETRANRFGADLLLPPAMFKVAADGMPPTLDSVSLLADRFRTSLTATAIRLVELGGQPAMVALYGTEGRKWFVPGPEVRDLLWPVRAVSTGSAAEELMRGGGDYRAARDVTADIWIDDTDADAYLLHEESYRIADELVLTLLWWEDESQVTDAIER